jgi:peptidoglycan/LPS O-acetylase OafA/YrhL
LGFKTGADIPDKFIMNGAVFMNAFFMLSGFILFFVYCDKDFSLPQNRRNFYIKRIARIYPCYMTAAVLSYFLKNNVTFSGGTAMLPMTLLCMQGLFYSTFKCLSNGIFWSMSAEVIFYCLFPFILQLFNRKKEHYKLIMLGSYLAALYPGIVRYYFGGTEDLYINPLFRLPEFICGMCIAHIYSIRKTENDSGKCIVFLFVFLIIAVGVLSKIEFLNHNFSVNNWYYYNCVGIPVIGALLYFFAATKNKLILKISDCSISNYLGKISFAFYLTQFIAFTVAREKCFFGRISSFIIPFFINLLLAVLMYELIEKKCRIKIINKFCSKPDQ